MEEGAVKLADCHKIDGNREANAKRVAQRGGHFGTFGNSYKDKLMVCRYFQTGERVMTVKTMCQLVGDTNIYVATAIALRCCLCTLSY